MSPNVPWHGVGTCMRGLLLVVIAWLGAAAALHAAPASSGIDRSGFDTRVRPQDDLYRAYNGGWLNSTPIPADKSAYGPTQVLAERAAERVRLICEELGGQASAPGSNEQKIDAYYRGYVETDAIDAAGLTPLEPWLAQIDAVGTPHDLAALWGRWQGMVPVPIDIYVGSDPKQPAVNRVSVSQSGLGLPDRDYYLKKDARLAQARDAYLVYAETLLRLGGDAQAAAHARKVLALETQLARVQWSLADSQDALKSYNPMTPQTLARRAPGLDWRAYFEAAELPTFDRLSVGEPSYAQAMAQRVQSIPVATWQLYLRVRLFDAMAEVMPEPWRVARFAFRGQALRGQEQQAPRWQQATRSIDKALGEAVGQIYVARHFTPQAKARTQELVRNLLIAYGQSIDRLKWMTPATKRRARNKLSQYMVKIGYPDRWRDYTRLEVIDGDALGNLARAGRFEHLRRAARVGLPVDRTEWEMTPQTVNAYYNAPLNEIVFPAAILDPPFFDVNADDAANYGATGSTIGHEISHGFDDQGSQYDGTGALRNWWTRKDRRAFDALGLRLVKQFDAYEALPGHRINGRATLGENMADLSGLEIAYKAWRLTLKGKEPPVIDGLTGDQRFFMAWAISWREKLRDAYLLELVTADVHAPGSFRANAPVMNLDAFHRAYRTRPGDRLYKPPGQRIRIW